MYVYAGGLLALIVFLGVLLSFLVTLPAWAPMVFIGMLALAMLVGWGGSWRVAA